MKASLVSRNLPARIAPCIAVLIVLIFPGPSCSGKPKEDDSRIRTLQGPEATLAPRHWAVTGRGGMVVAAHPLASRAGLEMLRAGGNAADALLAVQWALNVVEPQSSGIGGGALILYYEKKSGRTYALDGRETAPFASRPDMFLENGKAIRFKPERITGGLPVGTPGTLAVMELAFRKFSSGKISFARTFASAIRLAREGFRVSPRLALSIRVNRKRLEKFPSSSAVFFREGRPYRAGEILRQKSLAASLERISRLGGRDFYRGAIARDIVKAVRESPVAPGRLTLADLKSYRARERRPVRGRFRGHVVYSMPPPSSGIILLETLGLLERFSRADLNLNSARGIHLKLEAEKLAFADRAAYLADPAFGYSDLSGLLRPDYLRQRSLLIRKQRALPSPVRPGRPPGLPGRTQERDREDKGRDTTHFTIVDGEGNVVVCTSTIENGFGSALVVPGRGFLLNNELTDFSPYPGDINSPRGGKRPRSSMAPILIFKNGRFLMGLGSPGGTFIPGSIIAVILRVLNEGLDVQSAVNAPRALNRNTKFAELELPLWRNKSLVKELRRLGQHPRKPHPLRPAFGSIQAVFQDSDGLLWGGADPRREGKSLAVQPD